MGFEKPGLNLSWFAKTMRRFQVITPFLPRQKGVSSWLPWKRGNVDIALLRKK